MHCVIYKGRRQEGLYLFVAASGPDDGQGDLKRVPEALLHHLGERQRVMQLELSPGRSLARVDSEEVRQSLVARGYYLQMPLPKPELQSLRPD